MAESIPPLRWTPDDGVPAEYARISHDDSAIHLDGALARAQGLPGVILHGMHVFGQIVSHLDRQAAEGRQVRTVRCRFADVSLPGRPIEVEFGETFTATQEGRTVITAGQVDIS